MAPTASAPPGPDPYAELFGLLELPRDPERVRELRRKLVWAFSWAVPSRAAIAEIASHGPLIEIGAGTGYWAWLLKQAGADVVAFDRAVAAPPHWCEVTSGGAEQLQRFPERTLLLCWPPLGEGLAAECLEHYRGDTFLAIGEKGESARTGDVRFRARLQENYEELREIELPRWPGFTDSLTVYRRLRAESRGPR